MDSTAPSSSELLHAARRVSEFSVAWTTIGSTLAFAAGLSSGSIVLTAFGAIGAIDAVGSIALVHHFRHGLKHEKLSDRFERRAHVIVTTGLFVIGMVTVAVSIVRLATRSQADETLFGAVLAGVSLVVLAALAFRKQAVAARVGSHALRADGHLSAVGALQATVALAGVAASQLLHWEWADAVAAIAVGIVAVTLAVLSWARARTVE